MAKAYNQGLTPASSARMFVDRGICRFCKSSLPAALDAFGIQRLEIFSGGSLKPYITSPAGRLRR